MVIRAILLLLGMMLSSCLGFSLWAGVGGSTGDQGEPLKPVPVVVENVEALILESYPPRVTLSVSGHHGTGCEGEVRVSQWRDGSEVFVEIATCVPEDRSCPKIFRLYEATIPLSDPFEPGSYTVHVNGATLDLVIQ
jgi:hypothetical protein